MLRKRVLSSTKTLGDPCMIPGSQQDRDTPISAEHGSPLELHIPQSEPSPAPLAQSAYPATTSSRVAKIGLEQSRSPQVIGKEMGHNTTEDIRKPHTSVHRHGVALKPAIVQSVGTAKAVSMSLRPTPPSKPRSRTSALAEPKQKHALGKCVPSAGPQRMELLQGFVALKSASDEGIMSEGLPLSQTDGCLWPKASKRKRLPKKEAQVPIHSEWAASIQKGAVVPGCTHVIKTTSELLEEAEYISGTRPGGKGEVYLLQMPPEEMLSVDNELVQDSRIMEQEEIIVQVTTEPVEKFLEVTNADSSEQSLGKKQVSGQQPLCHEDQYSSKSAPQSSALFAVHNMADHISESYSVTCSHDDTSKASTVPQEMTYTDIMAVRGSTIVPFQRPDRVSQHCGLQSLSFLATWMPKTNAEEYKTIHHLCVTPTCQALPLELQLASQVCHAPGRLPSSCFFYQQKAESHHKSDQPDRHSTLCEGHPCADVHRRAQEARVPLLPSRPPETLSEWQKAAEFCVEGPRMVIHGQLASLFASETKMFWNPAPPKFACTPSFIRDKLFPKYQMTRNDLANEELHGDLQEGHETACGAEQYASLEKVLSRHCKSMTDLTMEEVSPKASCRSSPCVLRPWSSPLLSSGDRVTLKVPADFRTVARELEEARQQLSASVPAEDSPPATSIFRQQGEHLRNTIVNQRRKRGRMRKVPMEPARSVGVAKSRGGKNRRAAPLACAQDRLQEPEQRLYRSQSLQQLPGRWGPAQCPAEWAPLRAASLPLLLDSECFAARWRGVPSYVPQEWEDEWVFECSARMNIPGRQTPPPEPPWPVQTLHVKVAPGSIQTPDEVDLSQTLGGAVTVAALEAEVADLTRAMAEKGSASAFDLCRRGALNKKLGHLSLSLEDLNSAISLEPFLLDAYWHRHSIYLLRQDSLRALQDLDFITKHNNQHSEAFKSKAEIYRAKGDTTQAILNYTQAIKCQPEDDENYFRRAKMFEEKNEILLAMEDYATTFTINPGRTDALLTYSLHHVHTCSWERALENLSLLLEQAPHHATARTYRGIAFVKLGKLQEAVEDFAVALHLDPNNWQAFYHRGCLLRKSMPELALRDLSTSVLINHSVENLRAFLHRGLLYAELKQWQQAASDFKAVIKLDSSAAVAYVSLGLVYMLKMGQNQRAIQMFTNALKSDPTYIRGYICRAQAYHRVNKLHRALRDLTSAIHMKPDMQNLYIMRGQYLCDMEHFELATFCIHHAAEMNKALGSSPIQQAAVQSFLGNKMKAITCLVAANDACPALPYLLLLGKTQMKAQKFTDAVNSFRKALTLLCLNKTSLSSDSQAAEILYLTGLCYVAQAQLLQQDKALFLLALDAFSSAVKLNHNYADAYHQRGICRMHLKQPKSLQDFNRALSLHPTHFQAYLSRAALFGAEGRYAKAILNCNEAIQIQPYSVRAYLYRGVFKFHMKGYRGAVQDLTMAINIDSTCSFAFYNRGVCYQQLKEYELALKDYSIVLLLASRKEIDLKVLINRGLLYLELNDYQNALQDFKAASGKSPGDATIYHALGVLHHRLGQLQESTEAYTQALRLNPFFLDAYVGRGNASMDYGHAQANKQAQRDFLSALHLNPLCSSARISLGYNLQVLGSFQKAWNQFTVAVDIHPESWVALDGRAVISLQMGHTFAAFQDMTNALRQNPASHQLYTNRGVVNELMGDKVNAMRDYQKAISLNPKFALAYFNAANLYFHNRQFSQACEFYDQASELDPADESVLLNRAITHTLLRQIPEALRDFSEALRLNPFSSHVFFNRANLYCSLKKYDSAERELTEALHFQPNNALAYKLRADVRGHLGLTELAISDYKMALQLQEAQEH
ncbi:uncharacterized protein ttc6 isoform X1 [Anguilla rostrata]|uniref:uncharacterized protein ttc6 isoform X1 n=1 Tax=Anguilla rostrata TaxID=7938 RepID=UPI0030CE4547